MSRTIDKHTPYFELLESLQNAKVCALCEMRERSTHRYLENLLYEHVNDPGLRGKLVQSRGFCGHHAKVLVSFGDGLGTAILYQDQVKQTLAFLEQLEEASKKAHRRKAMSDWDRHAPCPACTLEESHDASRIGTLLGGIGESEMREAFEGSPGLCIPHLLKVLVAAAKPSIQEDLLRLERAKFSNLLNELEEYCRKHEYQHARKEYGTEADSWQRAVQMLLGRR